MQRQPLRCRRENSKLKHQTTKEREGGRRDSVHGNFPPKNKKMESFSKKRNDEILFDILCLGD